MAKNTEEVFQKIIDEAILEAELVECDIEEFREGLKTMLIALKDRVDMELS